MEAVTILEPNNDGCGAYAGIQVMRRCMVVVEKLCKSYKSSNNNNSGNSNTTVTTCKDINNNNNKLKNK